MKYFITVRILDILITLYGLNLGLSEMNPYNRRLQGYGFLYFLGWNLLTILAVAQIYKYKPVKVAVNIFTILNALVILMNIVLILLVIFNI